jgi:hypothetical protein
MPKLIKKKIRESTSYLLLHLCILFRSKTIKINVYANKYLHLHQKKKQQGKK